MIASRRLILCGLALCAVAVGATAPGSTTPSSAAPTAPTIAVTGHVSTYYLPGSYFTVALHRLTLHITGSGFVPGSKVRLAVMTTSPWKVLRKGWTYAQDANISALCPNGHELCSRPNRRAGTIDYRLRLASAPPPSNLQILYRSGKDGGMQSVTLQ